jgi:hypothetical protein
LLPSDGFTLDALTEVAGLLRSHVELVAGCSGIALIDYILMSEVG